MQHAGGFLFGRTRSVRMDMRYATRTKYIVYQTGRGLDRTSFHKYDYIITSHSQQCMLYTLSIKVSSLYFILIYC